MKQVFDVVSVAQTEALAARLAKTLKAGDIVALEGPLGAGKTVFARGLIRAFNPSVGEVPSPTFTLAQLYNAPDFDIWHFDLYRLKAPEEAYEIGIEEAFSGALSILEWPEKLGRLLPRRHKRVLFEHTPAGRRITIDSTHLI